MTEEAVPITDLLADARARLHGAARPLDVGDEPDAEELEQLRRVGVEEMRRARWMASVPSRFAWASLDDFAGGEADKLRAWADTAGPVPNLLVLGPVGVGKTHAALAACRPGVEKGMELRFLPVVELLDLLRPGGPEGAWGNLADVDRLIVDDVGLERATDWTNERFGALVNRRWMEERPTIATTNLEPKELREALGDRTYSRLTGSGAVVVRLTGDDKRRRRGA